MHYSFLRIKSAKHHRSYGEKSPCRDGLQIADKLHVEERLHLLRPTTSSPCRPDKTHLRRIRRDVLAIDPKPARDRRKVSTATKTLRRCSTAQTLPDAESYARGHLLRDAERCTHRSLHQ
ncbi:hypothetical protein FEK42_17565 [Escherichia sp. E2748]|nr:hypothetical protein D9734_20095 [Escherichia sp. E14S1]RZN41394.1 hypothetical protein D9738_09645 [Escherichia sp. E10V5]TBR68493.1 hypothetical protein D9737_08005 [Escherichia sp. E10V4]TGB69767.1 hypothetical protein CQB02_00905 [Escherichia coli]TGB90817.1 hypothetical protein CRI64_20295 [Escherichia sp. E2748]TGB96703.1 hypothetical protein CRG94_01835 [Escherichia sp. E3356]TGC00309.1 hypothetical protein CRG92_14100 [Escherichia sp. E2586]TGC09989.1 hypothetical protein CRG93_05